MEQSDCPYCQNPDRYGLLPASDCVHNLTKQQIHRKDVIHGTPFRGHKPKIQVGPHPDYAIECCQGD